MPGLKDQARRSALRGLVGLVGALLSAAALCALWRRRQRTSHHYVRRLRERARAAERARREGRDQGQEVRGWHETLEPPRYEWSQLLTWRVFSWLIRRAYQTAQTAIDGRVSVDELDVERLNMRKRWDKQDISHLRRLIGNTPMLAIQIRMNGRKRTIFMKCEQANLTGSIKDRMAMHILDKAYADGSLKKGDIIAEASSGNTGISFSALGSALGHPVVIYMPDWMSKERMALISAYGAEIVPVSRLQGGFVGSIRRAEEAQADQKARGVRVFLPRQFQNDVNAEAHQRSTGPEILLQLAARGVRPAAFVAGVGTGGTIMGVGRCLREMAPEARLHPVEPAESPTLTTGAHAGSHRIQGISDEFVPPVLRLAELGDILSVPDGDAILMAQKLARTLGIGAGISAGANFLAAAEIQDRLGGDAAVVSVICDDNKKYLSTDLARAEPMRAGYRCGHIELLSYEVLPPLDQAEAERVRSGEWKEEYLGRYAALSAQAQPADAPGKTKSFVARAGKRS